MYESLPPMLISVGSSNDVLLHSPRLRIAAAKEASAGVGGVCCASRNGTQLALSHGEMLNVLRHPLGVWWRRTSAKSGARPTATRRAQSCWGNRHSRHWRLRARRGSAHGAIRAARGRCALVGCPLRGQHQLVAGQRSSGSSRSRRPTGGRLGDTSRSVATCRQGRWGRRTSVPLGAPPIPRLCIPRSPGVRR